MRERNGKGLKPIFIRYTALLMGICYLVNPFQQQIFEVVHTISHALELPDNILSHDVAHIEIKGVHKSIQHRAGEISHDHELLELAKSIFKTSNEDNPTPKENFVKVKYDKHLVSNNLVSLNPAVVVIIDSHSKAIEEPKKGYLTKWREPPQRHSC